MNERAKPVIFLGRLSGLSAPGPRLRMQSSEFRDELARRFPELASPTVRMAVNRGIVHGSVEVGPDDEIAFFPPMSGG